MAAVEAAVRKAKNMPEEVGLDDEYDKMESELLARMTEDERREYVALNNN